MRSVSKALALALAAGVGAGLALAPGRAAAADPSPLDASIIGNYGEGETPRSAAMGGANRALGYGTSAVFLNPAALAETRVYHIDAMSEITPETRRWVVGGVVADSVTSRLAGSFSILGTPIAMDPGGIKRSFLDMRLALAFPITDRFIVGLTGRYLKVTQSGNALPTFGFGANDKVSGGLVDGSSDSTPKDRFALVNGFTLDAGLIIKPTDSLYIAAVGQNLTYANNGFMPLTVGGGIGYGGDAFSIEVDGLADVSSWMKPTARIMAGAEYKVVGIVPIRAGYRYDQGAKLSTLSLGTGYLGDVFSVEAAVKRTLSNPGATTIFFSVSYFLDSSGLTKAGGGPETPNMQVAQ
jgi:hypothetical protein